MPKNTEDRHTMFRPMRSLHAVLTCRVVLHMREQANIKTVVIGGSGIGGTGDVGTLIESMRFAEARHSVSLALEEN